MKKDMPILILLIISLLFTGCSLRQVEDSSASTQGITETTPLIVTESIVTFIEETFPEKVVINDCQDVLDCLSDMGFNLVFSIIYDENNDPNGAGEKSYMQKSGFIDGNKVEHHDEDSPLSGTIELFETPEQAKSRAELLYNSTYQLYAAQILADRCLLRLGYDYSEEEIIAVAAYLGGEVFSNLNSGTYSELNLSNQFHNCSFSTSDDWIKEDAGANGFYLYPPDSNGFFLIRYDPGTKIKNHYLSYIEGTMSGANAAFRKAEMVSLGPDSEAIRFQLTFVNNGNDYYITTFAFDGEKGLYSFSMIEPVNTVDKIEVYYEELLSSIHFISE